MLAGTLLAALPGCDEPDPFGGMNDAWEELHSGRSSECSGVVPPDGGPFGGQIALTFDDGPDLTDTPKVLETLRAHGATGTFFVNGRSVTSDAHRELLRQMVAEGHIVANHSQDHINSVTVSDHEWRSQVFDTHEVLMDAYEGSGQDPAFFRFPYGSANCDTHGLVSEFGYSVVGWHIDSADWCFQSSTGGYGTCSPSTFAYVPDEYRDDFIGFSVSQAKVRDGGILLFHDIHSFTVDNLDALLTRLEDEGYQFTTLDDVDTFPMLNGVIPPHEPWIGDPCGQDTDCAFSDGDDVGYCHLFEDGDGGERGYCSLSCDGYCPDLSGTAPTFCVGTSQPQEGMCVSKTSQHNDYCVAIPGTEELEEERFVYLSGASASSATVCVEP